MSTEVKQVEFRAELSKAEVETLALSMSEQCLANHNNFCRENGIAPLSPQQMHAVHIAMRVEWMAAMMGVVAMQEIGLSFDVLKEHEWYDAYQDGARITLAQILLHRKQRAPQEN